jgi:hypothetical protein
MRWVDAVLAEFHSIMAWPVESLKLDDLMAYYKAREERDACRLTYRLNVAPDGTVVNVTASSDAGAACAAPLMVPGPGGPVTLSAAVAGSAEVALPLPGGSPLKWGPPPKRRAAARRRGALRRMLGDWGAAAA